MSAFSLRPFLLLLLLAGNVCAQTTPALRQAESLLTSDNPLQAEKAFRGLLTTTTGGEREFCYDRLMTIYIRLGRFDAAIRNGLEFEAFLRRGTETDRLRQLQYELGWCWYTQGHDDKAADWLGQAIDPKGGRLVPETRMQAMGILARVADRRRQPQAAREYRESIREESGRMLQANTLPIRERYDLVSLLGEACSGLNEHSRNIAECQKLLPILERGKEPTLQRSVLRQLSKALVEEREYPQDRKSTRLNSSHSTLSRMPSSA